MVTYIVQRLLITIPLLLGLTFVIFMIIQIAPGDFFDQWALQPDLDQRQLRQWKREFGADKGWMTQYVRWLRGVLFDVRFARERVRIGDFEYDTLAENRDAYDIGGDATPIHVRLRDQGSFALAFNFGAAGGTGVLGKTDNPNVGSEHPRNHWSEADFQALEMDLRNDTAAGADVFLRIQDANGRALVERRFIAAGAPASITLRDADYARFGVDRRRLKGFMLFARQHGGLAGRAAGRVAGRRYPAGRHAPRPRPGGPPGCCCATPSPAMPATPGATTASPSRCGRRRRKT